ncbi:hypothetical protein AXF42_Ash010442 [Apostasia shenzhenica]|uniref:Uncharacterized protein n=1 Tax=Apostasia shenzhenica TaxID=1088818 RepID=A0A2I0BE04_9ASPA|nr:hypothetical protein AXF42_Ash010442 [Apostasia shenzhenica]
MCTSLCHRQRRSPKTGKYDQHPFDYNVMLGHHLMAASRMVSATLHFCLKFPKPQGIVTVRGDKCKEKCYKMHVFTLTTDACEHSHAPPNDENEFILVLNGQAIIVSKNFCVSAKTTMWMLLFDYFDVFPLVLEDMLGLDRDIAEHKLSLDTNHPPFIQKKINFNGEK